LVTTASVLWLPAEESRAVIIVRLSEGLASTRQLVRLFEGVDRSLAVARQCDGATVSPVAWGQARSIGDVVVMMAAGAGAVKWDGGVGGVLG
jgi:hypothetical protein